MTEFEDISLEEMISDGFDIVAEEINLSDLRKLKKFRTENIPDTSCKKYGNVP
jgi:ATP-dependent Lon protease